jgi:hypothetical protein
LNIRLIDTPHAKKARVIDYKRFAAEAMGVPIKLDLAGSGAKPGASWFCCGRPKVP